MKTNVTKQCVLIPLVISALLAAFFSGCDSSYKSPSKTSDSATNNPASTSTNTAVTSPPSTDPSKVLLGVWKGPAGTGQQDTTVDITQYLTALIFNYKASSGTLTWSNGDMREVQRGLFVNSIFTCEIVPLATSTSISGPLDNWTLTYKDNTLSGTAIKLDQNGNHIGTYDIFLTRQ